MKSLIIVLLFLRLQNVIDADKEDGPDTTVVKDAKKGVKGLKEKVIEKTHHKHPKLKKTEDQIYQVQKRRPLKLATIIKFSAEIQKILRDKYQITI